MSAKSRWDWLWVSIANALIVLGSIVIAGMFIYGILTGFADYMKSKYRQGFEDGMRAEAMLRDGKKLDHGTLREEGWRE